MPDVNNDMDELFKKAAEHYPLNTDSSDWNEVYKALQPVNHAGENSGHKKKSRRFLWILLLLLPFGFLLNKYAFNPPGHKNTQEATLSEKHTTSSSKQKTVDKEDLNTTEPKEALQSKTILPDESNLLLPSKNIANKSPTQILSRRLTTNDNRDISAGKYPSDELSDISVENIDAKTLNNKPDRKTNENSQVIETDVNETAPAINKAVTDADIDRNKEPNIDQLSDNKITQPEDKTESVADTLRQSVTKTPKVKNRQQHFYAGVIAGPDLSTVKFQKIIKTGFTAGIIAGYKLNKKLSIESGFFLDKKYYYTAGEYFNTKHVYLPSYTKIEDLDGYCYMIELPLNIKYDFKSNKKVSWFAIIGSSSYFMKKEDYKYRYLGWGQLMEKELSYKNSSNTWASVINVGAGYSRKVGKTGTLRVEPYIKIPFKSVGVGNMPITSSGVYLGFTKNLF